MRAAIALRVAAAARRFGENQALVGVDLDVRAGESVGLVGPNGAGKTTLMRSIAGLSSLDAGSIELFGRVQRPRGPSAERRSLGLVPQEVALYPKLTARENLTAFGEFHDLRGRHLRDRVDEALDWTGLADRAAEPIESFSTGMRRRLNIACGTLHRPRLVLLDEPTVGVDPAGRAAIVAMLAELRRSGAALLETSHHLDELQSRSDRLVVMDRGQVLASGTLRELAEHTPLGARSVRIRLQDPDAGLAADGWVRRGETLHRTLRDVGTELPRILEELRGSGAVVDDLRVGPPSLEEVFEHLTDGKIH